MPSHVGHAANSDQAAYWNSAAGERWSARQEMQETVFTPISRLLVERAKPVNGEQIIDVGCGCGGTSIEFAGRVGTSGHVLGVDVSEPMLARARQSAPAGAALDFVLADATIYDFAAGVADLVVSRFGVMFFADPTRSFANIRSALRQNRRLVFVCWRAPKENPWLIVPMQAVYRHVPKLPQLGPEDPGPFSFAAQERVQRILGEAGFVDFTMEPRDLALDISAGQGLEAAVQSALEIGPANLALQGHTQAIRAAAANSIREALTPFVKGGTVSLGAAIWLVTARAP